MRSLGFDVVSWNEPVWVWSNQANRSRERRHQFLSSAGGTEDVEVDVVVLLVVVVVVVVVVAPCTASTKPNQLFPRHPMSPRSLSTGRTGCQRKSPWSPMARCHCRIPLNDEGGAMP